MPSPPDRRRASLLWLALLLLQAPTLLRCSAAQELSTLHSRVEHRRGRAKWNADLVVVLTWHSRSLEWVQPLFAAQLNWTRFAIYSKGGVKTCEADLPPALRPYVAHCSVESNAMGREAHTMALFLATHYGELPRLVLFLQDDEHEAGGRLAPLLNVASEESFQAWAEAVEAGPVSPDTCLCHGQEERFPDGYAAMYRGPMQWLVDTFLGHDTSSWENIRWPANAELLVSAAAIRRRDATLYRLLLELTEGVEVGGEAQPGEAVWLYGDLNEKRGVSAARSQSCARRLSLPLLAGCRAEPDVGARVRAPLAGHIRHGVRSDAQAP